MVHIQKTGEEDPPIPSVVSGMEVRLKMDVCITGEAKTTDVISGEETKNTGIINLIMDILVKVHEVTNVQMIRSTKMSVRHWNTVLM